MKKPIRFFIAPFVFLALMAPGPSVASALDTRDDAAPFLEHVANVEFKARKWSTVDFATLEVAKPGTPGETQVGDFAFVAASGEAGVSGTLKAIDVSDPTHPIVVSELCARFGSEPVLDVRADLGLLVITGGTCAPKGAGIGVFDISNPRSMAPLATASFPTAHQVTLHPTQPIAYVGNVSSVPGVGNTEGIGIIDLSDPTAPKRLTSFPVRGGTAHDIQVDPGGTRAYVSVYGGTDVLDITNGADPVLVRSIHDPSAFWHQWSRPSPDGATLVTLTGLESSYGCAQGHLRFYDLAGPLGAAVPTGVYTPSVNGPSGLGVSDCHANLFSIHPDPSVDLVASTWGPMGTRILRLDATTPESREVAVSNPSLGSMAQYSAFFKGHIYTVDMNRGLDVFRMPGT